MNQHNVSLNEKTYDPSQTEKQNNIQGDGRFDWTEIYYGYIKRCEFVEGLDCLRAIFKISLNKYKEYQI